MADPKIMFPVPTSSTGAGGKPFKVTGGDGSHETAEEAPADAPDLGGGPAKLAGGARVRGGEVLASPQPSHETVEAKAHGHSPRIPWPPAVAIDEKREAHKDGAAHEVSSTSRKPFKI